MDPLPLPGAGTGGRVMRLALPVMAEQLAHMLVGFVDTWLAGKFLEGEANLAAMTLVSYTLWLLPSLFALVGIGATAMVARFIGARDYALASRTVVQALNVGTVLSLVTIVLSVLFGRQFIAWMQLGEPAAGLAERYLAIMIAVLPFIMIETVGVACLRGAGDTVGALFVLAISNVVDIVLSTLLVLGAGPIPSLGWDGLAIGSAAGYVVSGVVLIALLVRGRAGLHAARGWFRFDRDMIRRLLRIGVPGGMDILSIVGCQLWFVSIINQLGEVAAAAHGVGIRIESLAYFPGTAFQVAASTLAGQHLGAGDWKGATRSVLWSCAAALAVMSAAGAVFYFTASPLAWFFLDQSKLEVVELTVQLLRIVAYAMPPLAILMVLSGALRGAGDTRWPLIFTLVGFVGVRIPLAYFLALPSISIPGTALSLPGLNLGVRGAWYAMVTDLVIRCCLVIYRFRHGGWKHVEV